MAFFPFMVDISGKRILIIGGGRSALQKIRAFRGFGAHITVVAPDPLSAVLDMRDIELYRRPYEVQDLEKADLIIAASGDRAVNREIAEEARRLQKPVNAVDDREFCDFIFPAIVRREHYTVAVSTDGRSPLLAREIKKEISRTLPDYFDTAVGELGTAREAVLREISSQRERQEIFSSMAGRYLGKRKLRIGTRGSELAMIQTEMVIDALTAVGVEAEVVVIRSRGDRLKNRPLQDFGGKSVFVTDFEDAILKGKIDIAVHSAKDMPAACSDGLAILACLPRGDVRDVLVTRKDTAPEDLRIIGSGSLRRKAQILKLYPEAECLPVRGNVPTRLHKLRTGEFDGVILAAAGLQRLQLDHEPDLNYDYLEPSVCIPAAGQAVIAVEGQDTGEIAELLKEINDVPTWRALDAERRFMRNIQAGCHEAVGAWLEELTDGKLRMNVMKQTSEGMRVLREEGCSEEYEELTDRLAERILREAE